MKIYTGTAGDSSVGIPPALAIIDIDQAVVAADDELREATRATLKEAFSEIFDGYAGVRFEDECVDCGLRDGKHKAYCPGDPAWQKVAP